jgi:hypothetical protein
VATRASSSTTRITLYRVRTVVALRRGAGCHPGSPRGRAWRVVADGALRGVLRPEVWLEGAEQRAGRRGRPCRRMSTGASRMELRAVEECDSG